MASPAHVLAAVLALACAAVAALAATPMGPTIIPFSSSVWSQAGKNLASGSQPVVFMAVINLKPGTDVDKWIATREAVVTRARKTFKQPFTVAYFRGAMPAKVETLPQAASTKLSYFPVGCLVTMPDAKTYADYNTLVAADPAYKESGKAVTEVVRATNVQM